jgi:hypothetical protein
MKIAIPTHRRSNVINKLTLSLLKNIDKKNIYIFISDIKDMVLYEKECIGFNLVLCNTNNATDKFNYIQNYFDTDEFIFVIEDDIKKIQSLVTDDILKLFKFIESYCLKNKINSFGVYPSSNKFFMSKTIDIGLTYIVANLFGFKSYKDNRLLCKMKSKTDYERSVLYYNVLGDIARFNFISCLTNNYSNVGGMQEINNRTEIEKEASTLLCKIYPNIYSINKTRKSKYTELKMNKNVIKYKI